MFKFNDELDALWQRCVEFVESINEILPIHPLHLALVLLYDGLQSTLDPRLFDSSVIESYVFERPLFWVAISRVSFSVLPDTLDEHIHATTYKDSSHHGTNDQDSKSPPPIQYLIGQALWKRIKEPAEEYLVPAEEMEVSSFYS